MEATDASRKYMYDSLTEARIIEAFDETSKQFQLDQGKFVRLTQEYHDAAKEVASREFAAREPLSLATGMTWTGQIADDFWMSSLKQNISVGIVDEANGEIMALRLIRWEEAKDNDTDVDEIPDEAVKTALEFIKYCEQAAKFTQHFPTKEYFHFFGLVVPERYSKSGLATKAMEFSVKFLENLGLEELVIKGEATSAYARKIYEKLGFKRIFEISFEDYIVNSEQVFKTTGESNTSCMYGLRLN